MTKAGHAGDVIFKFENSGFDSSPSDSTFKGFGGDVTMDTNEGSHEAVRVFNAGREAAETIKQVFSGSWSVTGTLGAHVPWWFEAIWGAPSSTNISGSLYEHVYDLDNDNDPTSLRLYLPTDGFDARVLGGCVIAQMSIDQSSDGNPEFSIQGAYASEPTTDGTVSGSDVPSFGERSFSNRLAQLDVGSDTVGRVQNATADLSTGAEIVTEVGASGGVDWTPKTMEPDVTYDHILFESQTVDFLDRFRGADDTDEASINLLWDNGKSGDDQYKVDFDVTDSFPNQFSESGRNDPEADLIEELQGLGRDMNATITVDTASPPT